MSKQTHLKENKQRKPKQALCIQTHTHTHFFNTKKYKETPPHFIFIAVKIVRLAAWMTVEERQAPRHVGGW